MFVRRPLRLCGLCTALSGVLLLAATPARPLGWMRVVDPPPEAFRSGPTLSGRTRELVFDDLAALNAWCRANGVTMGAKARAGAYFQACYSVSADTVAIPSRKAWPSSLEIEMLREHEWAHARGWQHPGEERPKLKLGAATSRAVDLDQQAFARD